MISTRVVLGRGNGPKVWGNQLVVYSTAILFLFFAVEENPMELLEKLLWRVVSHWIRDTYLLEV